MSEPYDLDALRARMNLREGESGLTVMFMLFKAARSGLLDDAALGREHAATIARLTAERDEARARAERAEGALERIANGPRDAAETYAGLFAAICTEARAALTQEATDGQA